MSRAKNLSNKVMINGKAVYFDSHSDATEARENSSAGGGSTYQYDTSSTQTRYVQAFVSPGSTLDATQIIYYTGNYVTAGIDNSLFWNSPYAPQARSVSDSAASGVDLATVMIVGVYMGDPISGDDVSQTEGVAIEVVHQGVVTLRNGGFYPAKGSGISLGPPGSPTSSYPRDPMRQGQHFLPGWKQVQSREEESSAIRLYYIDGNIWPTLNPPSGTVSEAAPAGGGAFN